MNYRLDLHLGDFNMSSGLLVEDANGNFAFNETSEGKQRTSLPVFKSKEFLVDGMWEGKTSRHDPNYGDVDNTFCSRHARLQRVHDNLFEIHQYSGLCHSRE